MYDAEGSERKSSGSVAVGAEAWWFASLTVPMSEEGGFALLHVERRGVLPGGYRGDDGAAFSVPEAEVGAVLTALYGLVEQARQDGVLRIP